MKIIFLDCDGTLNHGFEEVREPGSNFPHAEPVYKHSFWWINKRMFENLARVVRETSAEVVLITVWRKFRDGRDFVFRLLREHGSQQSAEHWTSDLAHKYLKENERPHEIKAWLAENPQVERFVIFDDEDHYKMFPEQMFHCRTYHSVKFPPYCVTKGDTPEVLGITEAMADRAIKYLNEGTP